MKSIKEEIEEEIRDDVKEEVKEELKSELKDDIKAVMKSEITGEIQGVKTDSSKMTDKTKTLYDGNDGLYRLVKDNLTMAEAVEIQEKIRNKEYGERRGWYRREDDNNENKFCVWQLLVSKNNLSSDEITALERSVDIVNIANGEEEMNEIDKKTIEDIKGSLRKIEDYSVFNKNRIWVLSGTIGLLYVMSGAVYLRDILHADHILMSIYLIVVVTITVFLLWIQCECRNCI